MSKSLTKSKASRPVRPPNLRISDSDVAALAKRSRLHSPQDFTSPICFMGDVFDEFGKGIPFSQSIRPITPRTPSQRTFFGRSPRSPFRGCVSPLYKKAFTIANSPFRLKIDRPNSDLEHKFSGVPLTDDLMNSVKSNDELIDCDDYLQDYLLDETHLKHAEGTDQQLVTPISKCDTPSQYYNNEETPRITDFGDLLTFVVDPDSPKEIESKSESVPVVFYSPSATSSPKQNTVSSIDDSRNQELTSKINKHAPNLIEALSIQTDKPNLIETLGIQTDGLQTVSIKTDFSKLRIDVNNENNDDGETELRDTFQSKPSLKSKEQKHEIFIGNKINRVEKLDSRQTELKQTIALISNAFEKPRFDSKTNRYKGQKWKGQKWESAKSHPRLPAKCNCRKSKCLKLYCECFANEQFCNDCDCQTCMNTPEFVEVRKDAVRRLTHRNPGAFIPKSSTLRGCRCKRTRCQKKYCECFAAGKSCGIYCKCSECLNKGKAKSNVRKRSSRVTSMNKGKIEVTARQSRQALDCLGSSKRGFGISNL